jgi:hypothetical protein
MITKFPKQLWLFSALLLLIPTIKADPPFIIDSPIPTGYQFWTLYLSNYYDRSNDSIELSSPWLQFEYGLFPDFSLNLNIPVNHYIPNTTEAIPTTSGLGDIYINLTYEFLKETTQLPSLGFIPYFYFPTGDVERNLGNGKFWLQIPMAFEKNWGDWQTYGEGGITLNTAEGSKNYKFAGWVLQRQINSKLNVGAEIYTQEKETIANRPYALLNIGGTYALTEQLGLQASVGKTFTGENHTLGYLGLIWSNEVDNPQPKANLEFSKHR